MSAIANSNISSQKKFTHLQEVKSTYRSAWYMSLAKKITDIVSTIFNALCFWKWFKNNKLTNDQLEALHKIKNKELNQVKVRYQKKRQLRAQTIQPTAAPGKVTKTEDKPPEKVAVKSIYANREFDPSLESLREFVGEFVENSISCVYDEKIDPIMAKRQSVANEAEKVLKKLSPLVVHLGDQAKGDLFDLLTSDNQKDSIDDSLHRGLHWLLERDQSQHTTVLLENLEADLKKRLKSQGINADKKTIEIVTDWVNNHKNKSYKTKLTDLTLEKKRDITRKVSQECISHLFEKKIEAINKIVKEKLVDKLDSITKNFLLTNGRKVADEISGRIAEVLSQVQFDEVVDKLVDISYTHVKNYIAVEDKIKTQLAEAKIKDVNDEKIAAFIEENISEQYPTLQNVHPLVKDSYLGATEGVDKDNWRKAIENRGIKEFVRDTYEIICAQVTVEVDGQPKSIDWLEYLFEQIELPTETIELIDELKGFVRHVLPEEDENIADTLENLFYNTTKELAVAIVRSQVKKLISQFLYQFYTQLISQEQISKLFANYFLPAILEKTIEVHVENITLHHKSTLLPLLKKYKDGKSDEREKIKVQLYEKIWELTQQNSNQFDFNKNKINKELFIEEYSQPLVDRIINAIESDDLKKLPIDNLLEKLLATKTGEKDPRYSEMILDMVFKIGEFGGGFTKNVTSLFTGEMSSIASGTIDSLTEENFLLIDIAVANLQKKFGTKESIQTLYFGNKKQESQKEPSKPANTNKQTNSSASKAEESKPIKTPLHGEIEKLANVIHDIAIENINFQTQGWFWKWVPKTTITNSVLGKDSTSLQNMMIKMFNKILFNGPMNSDFYFKTQDVILSTLKNADTAVKEKNRSLNVHKVDIVTT